MCKNFWFNYVILFIIIFGFIFFYFECNGVEKNGVLLIKYGYFWGVFLEDGDIGEFSNCYCFGW